MKIVTDPNEIQVYQLELTSVCNLSCSFCGRDKQWASRDHGFMDMELLHRMEWGATKYTELQLAGEPCLHPKFAEIVRHIKSLGILVGLSTNATVSKADLDEVDIITNTIDKERDLTLEREYPGKVFVQRLGEDHPYEDTTHTFQVSDDVAKKNFGCATPRTHVTVQWDGDVVPCCKCFGKQHVFGNLYDQTMGQILVSRKRLDFLGAMECGKKLPYICRYCTTPNPHLIHAKLREWRDTGNRGKSHNMP